MASHIEEGGAVAAPATATHEGFDEQFFALLEEIEPRSFWFRSRNRIVAWALETYFPEARSLLEVGCGTGFVLAGLREAFPGLALTGGELFPSALEIARRRLPDVSLLQMDGRAIPFRAAFDVVGAFDVLEHVAEDEAVLAEMFEAARPGGGLLLTVPQHPWLWSAFDDFARHERRYTRRELQEKVTRAGFRIRRATSFVSLLLPALWLSRLRQRRSPDPATDFRAGVRLDRALERVMDAERALVARGLSFPAGGSLLVVAERPQGAA